MNRRRLPLPLKLGVVGQAVPSSAHASFLPPEMMDSAAMGLAWFNIVAVPIGAIVLFRMVRVLPEKIAHKRHHPQRDAIQVALGGGFGPPALEAVATKSGTGSRSGDSGSARQSVERLDGDDDGEEATEEREPG